MEEQLFKWKNWEQIDTADLLFHECELVEDIGSFAKGTLVDSIVLLYSKGIMEFQKDGKVIAKFNLTLQVEQVDG